MNATIIERTISTTNKTSNKFGRVFLAKQANPNSQKKKKQTLPMAEPSNKTEQQDGTQNPQSWIDLSEDVTASILLRLGTIEILVTDLNVCTTWRRICKDPRMWHTIDICDVSVYGQLPSRYPMDMMCRKAIDLTCGNLVNISTCAQLWLR